MDISAKGTAKVKYNVKEKQSSYDGQAEYDLYGDVLGQRNHKTNPSWQGLHAQLLPAETLLHTFDALPDQRPSIVSVFSRCLFVIYSGAMSDRFVEVGFIRNLGRGRFDGRKSAAAAVKKLKQSYST